METTKSVPITSLLLVLVTSSFYYAKSAQSIGIRQANSGKGPISLEEELDPDIFQGPINGLNRFSYFFSPPNLIRAQTPFVVRWGLIYTMTDFEIYASCTPGALSFFGINNTMPDHLCNIILNQRLIKAFMLNYIYRREFPTIGVQTTQYLISLGLNPFEKSNNLSTPIGYATLLASRMTNHFKNDGWNSYGLPRESVYYRVPFIDNTGYKPVNDPDLPETNLTYPLRWQPLTQTDSLGYFFVQKHVTPNIGRTAKPILMPLEQLLKRQTKGPYRFPNRRKIHPIDKKLILRQSRKLFRLSARLTRKKVQEAFFWDNKFYSTGTTSLAYLILNFGLGGKELVDVFARWGFAEAISMHDAIILAWAEKRRHDLARPQTFIRQLFDKNELVRSYRGPGFKHGMVKAVEWESLIPSQPHSEYPSGSSMVCTANYETLSLLVQDYVGLNNTVPPLHMIRPYYTAPGNPFQDIVDLKFKTIEEMGKRCGRSRLWAGVHFTASIRDGAKASRGIGTMAFNYLQDLLNGRVPKYCPHCISEQ